MKVVRVAESILSYDDEAEDMAIKQTGYIPHQYVMGSPQGSDTNVSSIDELHEAAGRGCYESWERPNPSTATNSGYLANIQSQQHFSVLEHGYVTYWIDGVSRNLLLELERHRHLSYSVVSTRYVDMSGKPFVMPKVFAELSDDLRRQLERTFEKSLAEAREAYTDVYHALNSLTDLPHKVAREAARDILPGGISTTLYLSGNVRAFREVIEKRNSEHAAKDIHELAGLLLEDLKKLCPHSVQDV